MGNSSDTADKKERETPVHKVTLGRFAAGIYEVTFTQYDLFCDETGREKPSDEEWGRGERPVINVSWHDAKDYAEWLKLKTGLNVSLPSEAQWEYLARAGTSSNFWTGDKLPQNWANCRGCGSQWDGQMTAEVGSFKPNPWGLFDTAGNVAEWTLDEWNAGYVGSPTDGSAWLTKNSTEKVYRGGAWDYPLSELFSSSRDWTDMDSRYPNIGFRLVINGFPPEQKK